MDKQAAEQKKSDIVTDYEEYEKRGGADGIFDGREDAFTNKCVTRLEAFAGSLSSKQRKGKSSHR